MTDTPVPLPVLPTAERTEFGFTRTKCGCPSCTVNCRYIPGFLVPADLRRLAEAAGVWGLPSTLLPWAAEHLRASPGCVVAVQTAAGVETVRVPTLVPARQADGMACHWLSADGRCEVHANSPYGCAFCDSHMGPAAGQERSLAGIRAVATAWAAEDTYALVWTLLKEYGLVVPGPAESRKKMAEAIGTLHPVNVPRPEVP